MKKQILSILSMCCFVTLSSAQTYPGPVEGSTDIKLFIREGFFLKKDKPDFRVEKELMYNQESGVYTGTYELPDALYYEESKIDLRYTVVLEGKNTEADAGSRSNPEYPRIFNLEEGRPVNFWARLWKDSEDAPLKIQYICDGQRISLTNAATSDSGADLFSYPDAEGRARYVIDTDLFEGAKYERYIHTLTSQNNKNTASDILRDQNPKVAFGKGMAGRWQLLYDYPNFTLYFGKVLDEIRDPRIYVNDVELSSSSGEMIDGILALSGVVNTYTQKTTGGYASNYHQLKKYDINEATVKLFYQIDAGEVESLSLVRDAEQIEGNDSWKLAATDILDGRQISEGDHILKVWYESEYWGDVLKSDNEGAGYITTFSIPKGGATKIDNINSLKSLQIFEKENGIIELMSNQEQIISVYSVSGSLVKTVKLERGANFVEGLMSGFYLINNQKVVIK